MDSVDDDSIKNFLNQRSFHEVFTSEAQKLIRQPVRSINDLVKYLQIRKLTKSVNFLKFSQQSAPR